MSVTIPNVQIFIFIRPPFIECFHVKLERHFFARVILNLIKVGIF